MARTSKKAAKKGTNQQRKLKDKGKPVGDHVRQLASERMVKSFINEVIASKNRTSEIGQELSTSTKRASDAGVNVPAARIAARLFSKAKQDSLKGRVLWEDVQYYLLECTDFEKIAPAGMFAPEEAGQRSGKQAEIEMAEGEGPPQSLLDAADELEQQQQETAH
jgi:hypothetical protein